MTFISKLVNAVRTGNYSIPLMKDIIKRVINVIFFIFADMSVENFLPGA